MNQQPQEQEQEQGPAQPSNVVGVGIQCDRHGDITKGALYLHYTTEKEDGQKEEHHYVYCVKCLNEYLAKLQAAGEFGKVTFVPIMGTSGEEQSTPAAAN